MTQPTSITFGDLERGIQVGQSYGSINVAIHPLPEYGSLDGLDILPEASFDGANKQHAETCLPNTRRDVLDQIRRWADGPGDDRHRIYWLKGMAGTGKSTIALTIAREYSGKKRLGASFFFARGKGDLASTRRFAATIAVQLAEASPQMRKHIAAAAAAAPRRIHGLGLYDQWETLVLQPLALLGKGEAFPHSHPLVVVVDALDECDNNNDVLLLIQCLAVAAAVEHVGLRIFVTSRPDQLINAGFGDLSPDTHQHFILHDIERSIVNEDLAVYYKHQLGKIARTSNLDAAFLSDDTIQTLVQMSCGLFVHAATACRFVCTGGLLAGERLAELVSAKRLPAKAETALDRMYLTVLEHSLTAQLDPEDSETARLQALFRRIMGTIAVLYDALSPTNLAMLLGQSKETIASLLGSLRSLLDVPEEDACRVVPLHPSFREFLLDSQRCSNTTFYIDTKEAHRHLFECCLRVMSSRLRQDVCDLRRPGTRIGDVQRTEVDTAVPFAVQYACRYWVHHLERSEVDPQECSGIIAEFFEARFLFWLETLALIGQLGDGIALLQLLEKRFPITLPKSTATGFQCHFKKLKARFVSRREQPKPPTLGAIVHDAKRFLMSHSAVIEEAPLQAYSSALVFSPEASIIRRLYIHQLPKWILRAPALSQDWGVHLQTLSHPNEVSAVVFSPDGRLIVTGSHDNTVRVWGALTGAERRVLRGHSSLVSAVTFSPDGQLIVTGSHDQTVRVWDATTRAERRVLRGHSDSVSAVAFSQDGRLLGTASHDRTVRVWDTATWAERRILHGHSDSVSAVAFSQNGRLIVTGSRDKTVRVWDTATDAARVLKGHSNRVNAVAISSDSQFIVSGSKDLTLRKWDAVTGATQRALKGHTGSVQAVAISLNRELILSGSKDKTVRVWDSATGSTRHVLNGHTGSVSDVAISRNSQLIVSGSSDKTARLWDIGATGAAQRVVKGDSNLAHPSMISMSPDSRVILGAERQTVYVWDTATGAIRHVLKGHSKLVTAGALSPDNRFVVSCALDETVRVWDLATGTARLLKGFATMVMDVAISPDSRLIVSAAADDTIHAWDTATGAARWACKGDWSWITALAVSPAIIVFGSGDNTARVLDAATGSARHVLEGHLGAVWAVAVSPSGRFIVSGSADRMVRVWDAATGAAGRVLRGHSQHVRAVAVSPDSRLIASSSDDRTVRVWDAATGAEQVVFPVAVVLRPLSFCPGGKHLVADSGVLKLPCSDCACPHHVFAAGGWLVVDGEDMLYLHPDYQESFSFLSGSMAVYTTGGVSRTLQLDLSGMVSQHNPGWAGFPRETDART